MGLLQCGISTQTTPLWVKTGVTRTPTWESALTSNSGR